MVSPPAEHVDFVVELDIDVSCGSLSAWRGIMKEKRRAMQKRRSTRVFEYARRRYIKQGKGA